MLGGSTPLNPPVRGGLAPHTQDAFELDPPIQLVIGYHWLAFLNQIPEISIENIVKRIKEIKSDFFYITMRMFWDKINFVHFGEGGGEEVCNFHLAL